MVSWEPVGFMFFSTIETFSLYYLIMCLFRFKWRWYAWQVLFFILLMNLQSYFLRNDLSMANVAPVISIILFTIFFTTIVKLPLIFSLLATIAGYAIFAVTQTCIVLMFFGSIGAIDSSLSNGYLLQVISAIVLIVGAYFLYHMGKGFNFEFEKLRFKFEDVVLTVIIVGFLLGISTLLYYKEIYMNILVFFLLTMFFLHYSFKRERADD